MGSKKLIRNVLAMLFIVMMTTVMVLSSCSNSADSEYANITIRLGESGSGRSISNAEKSAATFNVYFNDSQVASNVSGTYKGTAQVGIRLKVRVDALINGKRIARGENTITVRSPSNDVDVRLNENREPVVGSIIMRDGSLRTKDTLGNDAANAIAVVYKVANGKVWAVGKTHERNGLAWCGSNAAGYNQNFTSLQCEPDNGAYAGNCTFTGKQASGEQHTDGSTGWSKLKSALGSNDDTNISGNYPAWEWVNNYAKSQDLAGEFATGWYLPSFAELSDIWKANSTGGGVIEDALAAVGGDTFGADYYWSSSQYAANDSRACRLGFGDNSGVWGNATKSSGTSNYVCAVRVFTY